MASIICAICLALLVQQPMAAQSRAGDPHYTPAGFFDIHVCNWPDRPPFYLLLFSTERYNDIESIQVYTPRRQLLAAMDLSRYRSMVRANKPPKRVFMLHVPIPQDADNGWFEAEVLLKDGSKVLARDHVGHALLGQVEKRWPADGEVLATVPENLSWQPVVGAGFYQVFIRDIWNDGKLIHSSKLIDHNRYTLPQGLLKSGGYYSWKVHARDVDGDPRLGDFNLGSQSEWASFQIE